MARFDEVMATFWDDGDYGVQQPLTDEMVREAERALGVTLPSALLALEAALRTEWTASWISPYRDMGRQVHTLARREPAGPAADAVVPRVPRESPEEG
ncbi:hypothetical protein AB0M38_21360 [Streptomyces sp. NPDC051742]|uniref:hypothetical protein n=1 Tax=unclassified Streptomyces TaxID=2593676 RepID=UPI00341722A9